jgi:GT2 family glycosyltransferase
MSRSNKNGCPQVYFIIVNWNQADLTLACLASLSELDYPNRTIILVDNGSKDDSVTLIRNAYPQVTVLETGQNLGYSAGNNFGIRHAMNQGADYVFLLNNDTAVQPTMLSRMVAVAESNASVGMLGPTICYFDQPDVLWSAENSVNWFRGRVIRHNMNELVPEAATIMSPRAVEYVDSCAILVKRRVIETIGMLDESYFINFDDADWNLRARQAGFDVMYIPSARVWHKVSAAMGQASPATTYYMTRNVLLFFWKHARGLARVSATLHVFGRTIRTVGAWTFRPKYRQMRRQRDANLFALRDAILRRFGPMGSDVQRICFGE